MGYAITVVAVACSQAGLLPSLLWLWHAAGRTVARGLRAMGEISRQGLCTQEQLQRLGMQKQKQRLGSSQVRGSKAHTINNMCQGLWQAGFYGKKGRDTEEASGKDMVGAGAAAGVRHNLGAGSALTCEEWCRQYCGREGVWCWTQ